MRISVCNIPYHGLTIKGTIPSAALNARLSEGGSPEISATSDPEVALEIRPVGEDLEAVGAIKATIRQPCSTCDERRERLVEAPIRWILQRGADTAGDIGVISYQGDQVDLQEPLEEALILQIDPFWHPERDGGSRCLACGKVCPAVAWQSGDGDLPPATVSLGSLLKKARGSVDR